jgi:hypothetical protein
MPPCLRLGERVEHFVDGLVDGLGVDAGEGGHHEVTGCPGVGEVEAEVA